ncbi:kR domain protein [Clostridium sp. CAG:465]|jgi:short-chain dehydrogenases of various substrate specificities|nr:kR domain protein [Clostridium sp. CAG:465]
MKALVTGASSGIGYEISKYLAKRGYDIIVVSRNRQALENLKNEIKTNVQIACMDLSVVDNCVKLYENFKDENIDVLINNAGFGMYGNFDILDMNKEIEMINVNILACDILTKLFLKDMKKRDSGYILNVGSIAGFMPGPLMSSYYASKSYVVKLTQAIRKELKKSKSGVSVSVLCPGPVNTNFNNTAGVKFAVRPLSSEYVAKYAVDMLFKKKLVIVPGFTIKLARFFSKFTPDNILAEITYYIQTKKDK